MGADIAAKCPSRALFVERLGFAARLECDLFERAQVISCEGLSDRQPSTPDIYTKLRTDTQQFPDFFKNRVFSFASERMRTRQEVPTSEAQIYIIIIMGDAICTMNPTSNTTPPQRLKYPKTLATPCQKQRSKGFMATRVLS